MHVLYPLSCHAFKLIEGRKSKFYKFFGIVEYINWTGIAFANTLIIIVFANQHIDSYPTSAKVKKFKITTTY